MKNCDYLALPPTTQLLKYGSCQKPRLLTFKGQIVCGCNNGDTMDPLVGKDANGIQYVLANVIPHVQEGHVVVYWDYYPVGQEPYQKSMVVPETNLVFKQVEEPETRVIRVCPSKLDMRRRNRRRSQGRP